MQMGGIQALQAKRLCLIHTVELRSRNTRLRPVETVLLVDDNAEVHAHRGCACSQIRVRGSR